MKKPRFTHTEAGTLTRLLDAALIACNALADEAGEITRDEIDIIHERLGEAIRSTITIFGPYLK